MARVIWTVIWLGLLSVVAFLTVGAIGMAIGGDPSGIGTSAADAILAGGIGGVLLFFVALIAIGVAVIYASLRLGRWTAHFTRP